LLGVALDVFESEPVGRKDLFEDPRMIISPHTGAFTSAAKNRMSRETIKVWKSFVDDRQAINQVDKKFIY